MHNTTEKDIVESNSKYSDAEWDIAAEQSALILVDFWTTHIIRSHLERCTEVIEERVVPVLEHARRRGVTVVHAPGFNISKKYPQWERYAESAETDPPAKPSPDWPPDEFRKRTGVYGQYARPHFREEDKKRADEFYRQRLMPAAVGPAPDDFVVAAGAQLHRLLTDRKILHLFYAGFATNDCVLHKDYGVRAMGNRGYNIILLRDCTTGIETHESIARFDATRMAIQYIESYHASAMSGDFIKACGG
jgi:nicotinamidase-related amidase